VDKTNTRKGLFIGIELMKESGELGGFVKYLPPKEFFVRNTRYGDTISTPLIITQKDIDTALLLSKMFGGRL